jgi:predicted nucleic acid-binding protein
VAVATQRPSEPAYALLGHAWSAFLGAVAIRGKLRGPDALYVWLARREGAPVCTLDREIVTRGARFCKVMAP